MTDLEQAREWYENRPYDYDEKVIKSLAALLACARLHEARRWRTHSSALNCGGRCAECLERLTDLEQAAGGSAAAGSQK